MTTAQTSIGSTPAASSARKRMRVHGAAPVNASKDAAPAMLLYRPGLGVDKFAAQVAHATPFQLVEIERRGVEGQFLKDLAKRLEIPALRIFDMLGVPKATAEKKVAAGQLLSGSGGQSAIGMAKLIAKAQDIVSNSTADSAKGFDAAKWLGKWLEVPQPALGGRKPSELLDTPTGIDMVLRVLGAMESGAYQ